jgi:nitrogen regulatory protein PII
MIRVEIIANRSVEENILEALAKEEAGKHYTMIPSIFGVGACGPRMGTSVWPEENFSIVIWCEEDEARRIQTAIKKVKEKFPGEGIKLFGIQ